MPKGLRADEEFLREYAERRTRWTTGTGTTAAVVDTDQRARRMPEDSATEPRVPVRTQPSPPLAHVIEPPSKYHNKKTNGYASKREALRAAELHALAAAGAITDLREQVPYLLVPKAVEGGRVIERAACYIADFVYRANGEEVVEDCKGMRTDTYVLKRKLMLMIHGIRITET